MDDKNQDDYLYWGWKATQAFKDKQYKVAFRYASRVLKENEEYTKMYRIAASSAGKIRDKSNRGLWELYLSKNPEGQGKEEAERALK